MIHITITGPYAGMPLCGCDREAEHIKGNTFAHVPYTNSAKWFACQDICPKCKEVWFDDNED